MFTYHEHWKHLVKLRNQTHISDISLALLSLRYKYTYYVYLYKTYRRRTNCNRNELRMRFSASSCVIELVSCPSIAATPSPG